MTGYGDTTGYGGLDGMAPGPAGSEWSGDQGAADAGSEWSGDQGAGDAATGHPLIDAAMRDLAGLRSAAPAEQLPAFQAVHRTLQEALTSIDQQ